MRARWLSLVLVGFGIGSTATSAEVDRILNRENKEVAAKHPATGLISDSAFLRRSYVDLIGRIPSVAEIKSFQAMPAAGRRGKLVDQLLKHPRFADRWTVFFADLFRVRSNAPGGTRLMAYIHQSLTKGKPYDVLCRELIAANGRSDYIPAAGFVLADNADPMALAGITAQVFMGIRISCAQCHDHPFDVWKRKDFYELAAFFGKTRRVQNRFANVVYTTEVKQSSILWPPEGVGDSDKRKPIAPRFLTRWAKKETKQPSYIQRLNTLRLAARNRQLATLDRKKAEQSLDDLLNNAGKGAGKGGLNVRKEAKAAIRQIDVKADLYRPSALRKKLATLITDPRNRLFSESLANRVWSRLMGRGIVEPIDDFRRDNAPSHPQTLRFLGEEFVASDFNFRHLVKLIITSQAYQRRHAIGASDADRTILESRFLAAPMRRMMSESLYDSIVTAGHLLQFKHLAGDNPRTVIQRRRVMVDDKGESQKVADFLSAGAAIGLQAMNLEEKKPKVSRGYELERSIELNFAAILKKKDGSPNVEQMRVMSKEEVEAARMLAENRVRKPGMKFVTKMVKAVVDDNPRYSSALRMASPANEGHFVRIFGQPGRADLGEMRDQTPSMRQALMMLNGRLTHEAARVGKLEPMYKLLRGPTTSVKKAVSLAYLQILTRKPTADELKEALAFVKAAKLATEGMADLRWVLLNCHEFRYLP